MTQHQRERLRKWAKRISKMDYMSDIDDSMSVAQLKECIAGLFAELDKAEADLLLAYEDPAAGDPGTCDMGGPVREGG